VKKSIIFAMLSLIASMLGGHIVEPLNFISGKDTVINPNFVYQAIKRKLRFRYKEPDYLITY